MTDTGLPARRAALAIVSGVLRQRRALDFQLESLKTLSQRDAGFARALASRVSGSRLISKDAIMLLLR